MAHGDVVYSGSTSDVVEDWHFVRSPSRAARRMRLGHVQRIWIVEVRKDGSRLWPLREWGRAQLAFAAECLTPSEFVSRTSGEIAVAPFVAPGYLAKIAKDFA